MEMQASRAVAEIFTVEALRALVSLVSVFLRR
jgi:hypothetical protein